MSNFESPLGVKKISSDSKFREIEVPDETENQKFRQYQHLQEQFNKMHQSQNEEQLEDDQDSQDIEFERQVKAEREARRSGKERLSIGAKNRIEKLIGLTKTTRIASIIIDGVITEFTFISLSGKEARDSIFEASKFDLTTQLQYEIRKQVLARSITSVAGIPIEQFLSSNELSAKLEFIEKLDEALLTRLHDEYLTLIKDAENKFKSVKEIVEDIKK